MIKKERKWFNQQGGEEKHQWNMDCTYFSQEEVHTF